MSIANFLEDKLLNLVFCGTAYAGQATVYIKLHTGDPGEDCTANAAVETTRKAVTHGASSSGTTTSNSLASWTSVAGTETYSHISLWDAVSAGNALWSGALTTPRAVTAGDSAQIASAALTESLD